jgi:hypothetical protein
VQPLLGADRAIARGDHRKIGGAFEPHLAAMTAAGEIPLIGHKFVPPSITRVAAFSGKFAARPQSRLVLTDA